MAEKVECFPSKRKALSSNPSTTKKSLIYYMIQEYPSWVYSQRDVSQDTIETLVHPCLLQHYSQ
jgi:hypothetical protein